MSYLLDANVFIQAKNLHYGFDFCPAFWDWLIQNNDAKKVFSVEKVGDEVLAIADELADWANDRGPGFFLKPDNRLLPALTTAVGQSERGRGSATRAYISFRQDQHSGAGRASRSWPGGTAHGTRLAWAG